MKKRFLATYLRDVHHYLFDVEFAPPGKTPVRIQQTIRQRFVDALSVSAISHPHVVVSHSLGTVIAYDCLKRIGNCSEIDALITLGSPLGLDEIQDRLQPGWTRADGFPHEKVRQGWINLFDRLDPVCGFDPELANDFRRDDIGTIEDTAVQNEGTWRHSATKYLRQPSFCSALRRMLGR
jgi:pimeloyl-ACP methyl ester carboxylesterase